mgnify:CR=1 FL=1|tara:strand:+ start:1097 stop:1243 length:147 start_codon:yes stop_codon:yes gene_type:complete
MSTIQWDHPIMGLVCFSALGLFTYAAFMHIIPAVHAWEKAAGYPFGMM